LANLPFIPELSLYASKLPEEDTWVASEGPSFGVVYVRVVFAAGTHLDGLSPGVAHAALGMLERGTTLRDREAFHRALDLTGASCSFSAQRRHTVVSFRVLHAQLDRVLALISEAIVHPLDDEEELQELLEETDEDLLRSLEDPESALHLFTPTALWPGHTWRLSREGTRADRARITSEMLHAARERIFTHHAWVGVASDDPETIEPQIQGWWSDIRTRYPRRNTRQSATPAPHWGKHVALRFDAAEQAAVAVYARAPSVQDPDYAAALLHTTAFGSGFTSPLVQRIRSVEGLSYVASASMSSDDNIGIWTTRIAPSAENTAYAVRAARECWLAFIENGIYEIDLDSVKAYLLGLYLVRMETVRARLAIAQSSLIDGHAARHIETVMRDLRDLEPDAVASVATRYGWSTNDWTIAAALQSGADHPCWKRELAELDVAHADARDVL